MTKINANVKKNKYDKLIKNQQEKKIEVKN
jgi:hypothetical protein